MPCAVELKVVFVGVAVWVMGCYPSGTFSHNATITKLYDGGVPVPARAEPLLRFLTRVDVFQ